MFNFISSAVAQDAVKTTANQPNAFASFLPFIMVIVVFYFLVIRPQKKKLEQEQAFLNKLDKGAEVYTKNGILGTITGLTDKIVTLEVSEGVKIKMLRSQIGGLAQKLFESVEDNKKKA